MNNEKNPSTGEYWNNEFFIPDTNATELSKAYLDSIPDYDDNFTIETILQKILNDDRQYDVSKIISAYDFAAKAHEGQTRSSGQPYIIHPLAVAYTLIELGMDTDTICAALLHDVIEDTDATFNDLKKHFGQDVAMMVDGVTKISKVPTKTKEQQQAENIRKIILTMSKDIRVIIIKLADRLHNIRTLKYRPFHKQCETARETMHIYAPIAHRLGMNNIKEELEDLSFRYLDPIAYSEIENVLYQNKEESLAFIESIKQRIAEELKNMDFIEPPNITGRLKSVYSIYKKLFLKRKTIEEIYDKYAVRVIVSTRKECYEVLYGVIHNIFTPILPRLKDYIITPKDNMYQSIHTTVLDSEGTIFEVQIRTWEMHRDAEYGIAAHWKYKEGVKGNDIKMEKRLAWLRQLIEAQQSSDDVEEFVEAIKNDIAADDIAVMTPNGKLISLPEGSTPIDFAYRIHTEVGHKTTGAKVDGRIVPLDYKLQTGQICKIITTKNPDKGPNRAWLNIVKTSNARSKIRTWFREEKREENIIEGKAELERLFKHFKINIPEDKIADFLKDDIRRHNCENLEDFYASIGYKGILLDKLMTRLKDKYDKLYAKQEEIINNMQNVVKPKTNGLNSSIILDQIKNVSIKFAHCCNPLPGDEIVGFITRGYGLSVHTTRCTNYKAAKKRDDPEEMQRWCDIQWTENRNAQLQTSFEVIADDRVGLVHDITAVLYDARVPIVHSSSRTLKNGNALFESTIVISGTEQLKSLFDKIRRIKGIISVERSSV